MAEAVTCPHCCRHRINAPVSEALPDARGAILGYIRPTGRQRGRRIRLEGQEHHGPLHPRDATKADCYACDPAPGDPLGGPRYPATSTVKSGVVVLRIEASHSLTVPCAGTIKLNGTTVFKKPVPTNAFQATAALGRCNTVASAKTQSIKAASATHRLLMVRVGRSYTAVATNSKYLPRALTACPVRTGPSTGRGEGERCRSWLETSCRLRLSSVSSLWYSQRGSQIRIMRN